MLRSQHPGGFCRVYKFVVGERSSVPDGVSRPGVPVQIHQSKQESGIDPAAQEQTYRHVADQLAFDGGLIKGQQLFFGLARRLAWCEWLGVGAAPPAHLANTM